MDGGVCVPHVGSRDAPLSSDRSGWLVPGAVADFWWSIYRKELPRRRRGCCLNRVLPAEEQKYCHLTCRLFVELPNRLPTRVNTGGGGVLGSAVYLDSLFALRIRTFRRYVLEHTATDDGVVIVSNVNCGYLDMSVNFHTSLLMMWYCSHAESDCGLLAGTDWF